MPNDRRNGLYWILTLPYSAFTPYLPPQAQWIRGQLEQGTESDSTTTRLWFGDDDSSPGYYHWQVVVCFKKKTALRSVTAIFGPYNSELTRSEAANEYVWKEDTRVEGTQFELGRKPFNRARKTDWAEVKLRAKLGELDHDSIPPDVFVRCYHTLRRIASDYAKPVAMVRTCYVFWGLTGTGKTRRAFEEAGSDCFFKDPRSKFWFGYRGERNVVIDEFRGGIDISHLLRFIDRYPVHVETKGGSMPLLAENIWITSNVHPDFWYPEATPECLNALKRKIQVTHFNGEL